MANPDKKKTQLWCCDGYYEGPADADLTCPKCGFTTPTEAECLAMLVEEQELAQEQ